MPNPPLFRYDVYISYNEADAEWVFEWLLPRLKDAGLTVAIDVESFQPGAPVLEESERVIAESRTILAVLTPAYVAEGWDNFETLLVQNEDPGARFRRLIPLLLEECDPPARIKLLHWVEMTDPNRREDQLRRVIDSIQGKETLPELHPERIPDARQRWWELRWLVLTGVLSVVTLIVVVAIYLSGLELGPEQMRKGVTGIAVAEVGQLRADGSMATSELSQVLSQMLNDGFSSESINNSDPDIQLWHNGLSPAEMRRRLPYIQGSTPSQRAENARELAERIGATVVIYGHLTADAPPRFILEFYQDDPLLRTESVHTLGRYQFGDSLRINVDLEQTDNRETERLRAQVIQRATTLYRLLRALNQDLLGNPTEALAILNAEEQELQAWESEWNRVAGGKETLFFFIGRSLLFLDRYEEAEQALDKSLAINPTFPQAQITKGTVYLQAVLDQPIEQMGVDDFEQPIDAYRLGKSLAEEADEPLLVALADLALGITLRQQGDTAFVHGLDDRALAAFDEAILLLEGVQRALDGVPQYRLLGQAYESLGLARYQKALILESRGEIDQTLDLYKAAAEDFERCTRQSDDDRRSDQILLNDIVVRNCWPMRALVHETVGRLSLRQAQALSGDEQRRWYGEAEAAFGRCIEQQTLLEEELLADALILDPEPLAEISAIADTCRQLLAEIQAQVIISSNEAR